MRPAVATRVGAAIALVIAASPLAAREAIAVFGGWGAFRDDGPRRCFAIAGPANASRGGAFASVANWPGQNVRAQLHVRLSRARARSARITLSIGDRHFDLVSAGADAWAPDARTDAAIVAAMRSGRSMSVEGLGADGAPFADTYALSGAATAIDAATLACRR